VFSLAGRSVVTWGFADVIVSSAHINEQQCSFAQSANLHSITEKKGHGRHVHQARSRITAID
jgi:hypothetical protein